MEELGRRRGEKNLDSGGQTRHWMPTFGSPWWLRSSLIGMGSEKQLISAPSFSCTLKHLHVPRTKWWRSLSLEIVHFWSHFSFSGFRLPQQSSLSLEQLSFTVNMLCSSPCKGVLWCLSVHSLQSFSLWKQNQMPLCPFLLIHSFSCPVWAPWCPVWCCCWHDQRRWAKETPFHLLIWLSWPVTLNLYLSLPDRKINI